MSTKTTNFKLTKPDADEFYDIGVHNDNSDIIDAQMKKNAEEAEKANNALKTKADLVQGLVPLSQLPESVKNKIVFGYAYNANFYADAGHTTIITPDATKLYVDKTQSRIFWWNGTVYKTLSPENASELAFDGESIGLTGDTIAEALASLKELTDESAPATLTGTTDPTNSTVGEIGQMYLNTDSKKTFICTDANPTTGVYTWAIAGGGGVSPQLIVQIDTGSQVVVSQGTTQLTGVATDGKAIFDIPNYGTWDITASLNGETTSDSITISEVKQFTITLAYFSATLVVTAESGAVITVTDGTHTYTGTAASNGKYTFTVKAAGTYSISATKKNVTSSTVSKAITTDKGSYTATVTFIKLAVTVTTGSFIQVSNGSTSLTETTTGTSTFYLPNTGTWNVTATLGDDTGSATVSVTAYTSYAVTIAYFKIMTAIINLADSNPATCVTYADDAANMTAGSSAWDEFFGHYPCILKDGAELGKLNPNNFAKYADGTTAPITTLGNDVMIAFPRRGVKISTANNKVTISMTDAPNHADFKYYAHSRGSVAKDVFYLGAYKGYVSSSKLYSVSGQSPTVSQTIGTFRGYANSRGSGYDQSGFYQLVFRQCMYILKYKNLNSQATVGKGYTDGFAKQNTGATNTNGMDYGSTTSGTTRMKLFGIEDFWGNVWEWIDGLVTDGSRNILTNTSNFQDAGKGTGYMSNSSGLSSNTSGYMSKPQGTTETGFVLKEANGSETTYFSDSADLSASCVTYFGGYWGDGSHAGAFRLYVNNSASYSDSAVAARLMYLAS